MFASVIVRLPDPLRRAVAYLKAFALLEDVATRDPGASDGSVADPDASVSPTAEKARERRHGEAHEGRRSARHEGHRSAAGEDRHGAAGEGRDSTALEGHGGAARECRQSAAHEDRHAAREHRDGAEQERRHSGSRALSHRHRRPLRTRVDRLAPRRAGFVAASPSPCRSPLAPSRDTPARPTSARCSRRRSTDAGH
jgi:hypothetical protein